MNPNDVERRESIGGMAAVAAASVLRAADSGGMI